MKLKELLKETNLWDNRKFGDKLPTVADYKNAYNKKHNITEEASGGVVGELEKILVAWEDNVYPDDKTRWNDYYSDIEQLVGKLKGGEVQEGEEPEEKPSEEPEEVPSQVDSLGLEDNPFEKEDVKESLVKEGTKRIFIKEIQKWMKTLEENRYRKLVNADCRRVAWLVNHNMSEDYDTMPESMRKKWEKAQYGKERYLAREFIKHKKNEQKLRESIRSIIKLKKRG